MKENKYDEPSFFEKYSGMLRSTEGLAGAGEWHMLEKMMPRLEGKRILDLGCGFGWHCAYAIEKGASNALGVDLSRKMIDRAREINGLTNVDYQCASIEDTPMPAESYDVVISSLAMHYVKDFEEVARNIYKTLIPGGYFVMSVEHPVFTARGDQDWHYGTDGEKLHWPVDNYFTEGVRETSFLGERVIKYHKTLTTYVNGLLKAGFRITSLQEAQPDPEMLERVEGMKDEMRRPMMLLISAVKE